MVPPHFAAALFLRAQPRPLRPITGAGRRSLLGRDKERPLFSALRRVFVVRPQTALTPPGGSLSCRCGQLRVSVFALPECNPPEGTPLGGQAALEFFDTPKQT